MTYKQYSKTINSILLTLLTTGLISCGGGGGGDTEDPIEPGEALTKAITITGGTLVDGQPPAATNNPGDPYIVNEMLAAPTITPGSSGELSVNVRQMPLNTTSFNVNIQLNSSTNQFIQVNVNDPGLISTLASQGGSGTINLPFSVDSSVCDNIDDIQHQVQCYESVSLPDGSVVTTQTAQDMILACQSITPSDSGNLVTIVDASFSSNETSGCWDMQVQTSAGTYSTEGDSDPSSEGCYLNFDKTSNSGNAQFVCPAGYSNQVDVKVYDACSGFATITYTVSGPSGSTCLSGTVTGDSTNPFTTCN